MGLPPAAWPSLVISGVVGGVAWWLDGWTAALGASVICGLGALTWHLRRRLRGLEELNQEQTRSLTEAAQTAEGLFKAARLPAGGGPGDGRPPN